MPPSIRSAIGILNENTMVHTKDDLLQVGRRRIGGGEFDCLCKKK